jgi:hypothetical protein
MLMLLVEPESTMVMLVVSVEDEVPRGSVYA